MTHKIYHSLIAALIGAATTGAVQAAPIPAMGLRFVAAEASDSSISVRSARVLPHERSMIVSMCIRVDRDREDGRLVYDIDFISGELEYDYEIDAATGAVIKQSREHYRGASGGGSIPASSTDIGSDAALAAALAHAGVAQADATGVRVEREYDDGRVVYEVDFYAGSVEYDAQADTEWAHVHVGIPALFTVYNTLDAMACCWNLGVPLAEVSHQQGHVAASLWSAGRLDLLEKTHLAWHLSGGTTELLLVEPEGRNVKCTRIGGTTDISAGQLIDRTGQLLELPFPSGKHLDSLSREATGKDVFRVKCRNCEFSLSGVQNKVQQFHAASADPAETAAYALRCVAGAVYQATVQALEAYPGLSVVFSGGVASNSMLRELTAPLHPVFAQPQFSTDNAMGVAVLTKRLTEE
mgnify:CR=1 FL=1